MKKFLSTVLSAVLFVSSGLCVNANAEEITQTDTLIEFGRSKIGSNEYNNYCQRFVRQCYESAGLKATVGANSAMDAYNLWGNGDIEAEIPIGACLYFNTSGYGHVAIYTGNNQMIHGVKIVKEEQISDYYWDRFLGWGYQGGTEPEGLIYESEIETAYPSVPYVSTSVCENDIDITWRSSGENTSYYDLNVYSIDNGGSVFNQIYSENEGSVSIELPEGSYYAVVKAVNENYDNSASYSNYSQINAWNPISGDINHSGKIEIADMVMLGKYLMNEMELDEESLVLGDLNEDGFSDMLDYMIFKQYFIKMSSISQE